MNFGTSTGALVGSVIPGVGTVVGGTIGGIVDIFTHLFGGLSIQQEFQQWIIPIIYPEAQRSQCAVYVYWFGEIIGVTPSGQIVHFGSFPNITVGYATLDSQNDYYETYGEFQSLNSSNHYQGGSFTHHGSGILEQYSSSGYEATQNPIVLAPATAPIVNTEYQPYQMPVSSVQNISPSNDNSTFFLIIAGIIAITVLSERH